MLICQDMRTGSGCGAANRDSALHCAHCGKSLRFALALHDPGTIINGYRIVRLIGHGGFGAVYAADELHSTPLRTVALKETFDASSIATFQNEFAVLSRLAHPNLPGYYTTFEHNGNGYLAMELVPGQSLQQILDQQHGTLPESQVLGYALQLCDVLDYLHRQRPPILHRDIKPANVRLTPEGRIKLVDFGLFKQGMQQTRLSIRGLGTPAYAPIEQYGSGTYATDQRSDIYSLGATLYHLLTGQEPIAAPNRIATTLDPLPAPHSLNPQISRHVATAIVTAMSLLQQDRYTSASLFKQALMGKRSTPTVQMPSPNPRQAPQPNPPTPDWETALVRSHSEAVRSLAWSPDGNHLISASGRLIWMWRIAAGQLTLTMAGHTDTVCDLAWPTNTAIIASAGWDRTVRLWKPSGMALHTLNGHSNAITSIAFSPDGHILASASWDETVLLWDVATRRLLRALTQGQGGRLADLAWSPDGQILAVAGMDGTIRLWQVASGQLLHVLKGHTEAVRCIAWSPTEAILTSGSSDRTVRLWNTSTGALLASNHGHTNAVTSLAYHPDGQFFASGGMDNDIYLWDRSGNPLTVLSGHSGCLWSLAFNPNGDTLASASGDWTVRLWRKQKRKQKR